MLFILLLILNNATVLLNNNIHSGVSRPNLLRKRANCISLYVIMKKKLFLPLKYIFFLFKFFGDRGQMRPTTPPLNYALEYPLR